MLLLGVRSFLRSDHTYIRKALCEGAQSGISIVTGQIEIHSLLHSLRIPSYPARRCCIPKEAVRHYTVLDTSPKKSCASVIPGWSPCVASVSLYTTLSEREETFPRSPCAWWFMLRKVPEGRSVPEIFEDPVVKRATHQEDDTGLGATWPTLSSHAKSRQVTQTCQVRRLCRTWPKKRCRGQVCPKASQFYRLGQFQGLGQDSQDIQCHIQMI